MRTRPGAGLNRIRLRRVLVRDSSGPRCPSAPERVCWRHVDGHACRLSSRKPPRAKFCRKCCIAFVPMSRGRSLRRSFASSFCLFSANSRKFCGVIVWSMKEKYYFCATYNYYIRGVYRRRSLPSHFYHVSNGWLYKILPSPIQITRLNTT